MTQDEYITFDLRDVVNVVRRRAILIALLASLGTAAGFALASALTPTFQTSGEIVVKAEASVVADPDRAFGATAINQAVVTTERDVLLASGMIQRVAAAVTIPPALLQPGRLRTGIADATDTLRRMAQGDGVVAEALRAIGLGKPAAPVRPDDVADRRAALVRNSLSTFASKESSVISVTSITPDPALSTAIVNALLDFYMQDRVTLQNSVARNTESVLRTRLDDVRSSIAALEGRIVEASAKPGMLEGTEVPVQLRQLPIIGQRLAEAQANLAGKQADYDAVLALRQAGQNDPSRAIGMVDGGGTSTSDLRRSYLAAVQNLAQLQARQGANFPGVIEARSQVQALGRALSQEVSRLVEQRRADRDAAQATVAGLNKQYEQLRANANARVSPGLSLDRERETLASLRHNAQQIEDRLIDLAARPMDPNARILSYAKVPELPAFPKKTWFALAGGLLTACLAIGWTVVSHHMRKSRPSPSRQADYYRADLIGCIPLFKRGAHGRDKVFKALSRGGAEWTEPSSLAFQSIALECDDIIRRHQMRVLAITSGSHDEGKTTVAVGLALVLANLGSRVLIVDSDMRRPSVLPMLGRDTRALTRVPQAYEHLNLHEDVASGVHVATLPAASSLKYLRSSEFEELLSFGRKFYDVVLCDTPPVLMVPDALMVARQADGILLVAENGRHDADTIAEIARQTHKSQTPVRGLVLTKLGTSGELGAAYASYGEPKARLRRAIPALASN